ncbi:MAG TPA: energy transducer TonB [Steroidobacteraceae bacterium]|nr:energy transducer TonB [Steroidobacteraceae bacterium]
MAGPASTVPRETGGEVASQSPTSAPSARVAVEAIVVSTRDDFLLELGDAVNGHVSVRPVDTLPAALELLNSSRRVQLLIIDSRCSSDLRADIERAHALAPGAPVLAFALAESEKNVAGSLKGSNVFAVLPIPVDRRKSAAVFEGAIAEAAAKRSSARPTTERAPERVPELRQELRVPLAPEPLPMFPPLEPEPPQRGKPLLWIGIAAAGLAVAGGTWLMSGRVKDSSPPTPPTAVTAPAAAPAAAPTATPAPASSPAPVAAAPTDVPVIKGNVDELLEKARLAMRERRYTEPANDNALLYFRSALAADDSSAEARDGMARVAGLLLSRYEDSIGAGRLDDAAAALAALKIAAPGDARLAPFELRLMQLSINKALADGNVDRAATLMHQAQQSSLIPAEQLAKWRAELGRRQDDLKVKRLEDAFNERVRDGRLVEPDNDNAKYYLQQLHDAAPATVSERAAHDLAAAYLRKARDAALANHSSESERWLAEARAAGTTPADLNAFQRDLAGARQRAASVEVERLAQLTRDRIRDGHLTDPAQDSAVTYLSQLRDAYADSAAVPTLTHDFTAKLLERAAGEARAGEPALVEADLTVARRWGADAGDVRAVEQVSAARSSTTAAAQHAPVALPAGLKLKRTRYSPPEYPQSALDQKISGTVTVEFVIGTNGQTKNVRLVDSTPPKVFDRAALDAVSHWRYEPVVINSVPTEIPTHMVIRFELPK